MDDGSETEVSSGDVVAIPPGHDAEVVADEPCVFIDFGEFGESASGIRPVTGPRSRRYAGVAASRAATSASWRRDIAITAFWPSRSSR